MIKNIIKTAFRYISRNKLFSTINILGLSIGMACSILIFLWLKDELSYDRFHTKGDNIYRVVMQKEENGNNEKIARTPVPVGTSLKSEFPEVIASNRFFFWDVGFIVDLNVFNENGAFIDKDIFQIFDIKLLKGDTSSAFNANTNIIISEELANRIFNSTDVVGKELKISERTIFTISGVFENIPKNSHLKFDFLISYELLHDFGFPRENWGNYNNNNYTYVLLSEDANLDNVNTKIEDLIIRNSERLNATIFLQPLKDVYLKSNFSGEYATLGNYSNIYIFSIICIFIIIIASFNFMNLTTAQATSRLKEIGIRKVLGSKRKSLVLQFLGEAVVMAFVAHIVAIIFVELLMPTFNLLTGKSLDLNYFSAEFLVLILVVIVVVGLFSGSYPSAYLSGLNPLIIFKGTNSGKSGGNFLRKTLVIAQFIISIVLIISAVIIMKQMNYLNKKDLGFNKEGIIYFSLRGNGNNYELLKDRLLNYPEINNVTVLSHELTDVVHLAPVTWDGSNHEDRVLMDLMFVDHDFIKTMNMELIEGNDFKRIQEGDTLASFIINESAAKFIDVENPIGTRFSTGRFTGYITGIIKDFNFQPLYNEIKPMVLTSYPGERFYLYVGIAPENSGKAVSILKKEFKEFAPNSPFEYFFLNESIENMYKNENNLAKLTRYFTLIAILISSLGLFGLASFMAEKRTKEIGIRKALGASISRIVFILSKEIMIWVTIANVISWPLAYFLAEKWLGNFSYKISINIGIFIVSGILALVIALITVNLRAVKAAYANPVDALRYE